MKEKKIKEEERQRKEEEQRRERGKRRTDRGYLPAGGPLNDDAMKGRSLAD